MADQFTLDETSALSAPKNGYDQPQAQENEVLDFDAAVRRDTRPSPAPQRPRAFDDADRAALAGLFEATFGPSGSPARVGTEPAENGRVSAYVRFDAGGGKKRFERSADGATEDEAFWSLARKVDRHAGARRERIESGRLLARATWGAEVFE